MLEVHKYFNIRNSFWYTNEEYAYMDLNWGQGEGEGGERAQGEMQRKKDT